MKIFLGGTCADTNWRDLLIPLLEKEGIDYFNPVVEDWDEEAQITEEKEKENAGVILILITPQMKGVFSIAEAVETSNKAPERLMFVIAGKFSGKEFDEGEKRSLLATNKLIRDNGSYATAFLCTDESLIKDLVEEIKKFVQKRKEDTCVFCNSVEIHLGINTSCKCTCGRKVSFCDCEKVQF